MAPQKQTRLGFDRQYFDYNKKQRPFRSQCYNANEPRKVYDSQHQAIGRHRREWSEQLDLATERLQPFRKHLADGYLLGDLVIGHQAQYHKLVDWQQTAVMELWWYLPTENASWLAVNDSGDRTLMNALQLQGIQLGVNMQPTEVTVQNFIASQGSESLRQKLHDQLGWLRQARLVHFAPAPHPANNVAAPTQQQAANFGDPTPQPIANAAATAQQQLINQQPIAHGMLGGNSFAANSLLPTPPQQQALLAGPAPPQQLNLASPAQHQACPAPQQHATRQEMPAQGNSFDSAMSLVTSPKSSPSSNKEHDYLDAFSEEDAANEQPANELAPANVQLEEGLDAALNDAFDELLDYGYVQPASPQPLANERAPIPQQQMENELVPFEQPNFTVSAAQWEAFHNDIATIEQQATNFNAPFAARPIENVLTALPSPDTTWQATELDWALNYGKMKELPPLDSFDTNELGL